MSSMGYREVAKKLIWTETDFRSPVSRGSGLRSEISLLVSVSLPFRLAPWFGLHFCCGFCHGSRRFPFQARETGSRYGQNGSITPRTRCRTYHRLSCRMRALFSYAEASGYAILLHVRSSVQSC